MYELTEDEFESLIEYFKLSMTAVSDDDIMLLLSLDKQMLSMLLEIKAGSRHT